MAQLEPLARFILSYEGGFVNDPHDSGGATNKGVTIATWRQQGYDKDFDGDIDVEDLKLISDDDAIEILRKNYWNRWQADKITSQPIANMLVDWVWASGSCGIKLPQAMIGVKPDGIVGPKTLAALESQEPEHFFYRLKNRRMNFVRNLCLYVPVKRRYLNGWIRRINAIKYDGLVLNN